MIEVDTINLNSLECGGESLSGITGELVIDREAGSVSSGRPVLMKVREMELGTTQTLLLFDNHSRVSGNFGRFVQKLAPGRYSAELFIDTNSNGTYDPCDEETYGDRYHLETMAFELGLSTLLDLGQLTVIPDRECSQALQSVEFRLSAQNDFGAERPTELNIWVREAGGWGLTSPVQSWEESDEEWLIRYGDLLPESTGFPYTLTMMEMVH